MDAQRHLEVFREGSHGSMMRKPGTGLASITRGGIMALLCSHDRRRPSGPFACSLSHSFHHPFLRLRRSKALWSGTVSDPLGAIIAGATVELLDGSTVVKTTTTDGAGNFAFDISKNARYSVRAVAQTFRSTTSESVYVTNQRRRSSDIPLGTQT